VLNLATKDGLNIIVLSVFLLIISGTFQVMNDVDGIKCFVSAIVKRFRTRKFLLLAVIALIFMAFGALLGLFEEMLTLLPIIAILTVTLGYDSFTGFLVSIGACGFGFSAAITNPFTVIFASDIIGVNPMTNVFYRVIIFAATYALLLLFIFLYVRKIAKDPQKSMTFERDLNLRGEYFEEEDMPGGRRIRITYGVFFAIVLAVLISCSVFERLRDYTIVFLAVSFLIGGIVCGVIAAGGDFKKVLISFVKGGLSALPSVAFILLAASIKYVLEQGGVLPTIINEINGLVASKNPYLVALILYLIVLVLEFFISSSTAKAVFVMSVLGVLTIGLTKEMSVLIYTFADGYTNLLFPTSPVLLIGLSMIDVSYFKWLKKSIPLFLATAVLVATFIVLGIAFGY
ncbi:MAG: hypothetical protein J6U35_04205, partial [Clostridia bacterium]|nr:hypothetical protein [Clostridia bacterium]